MTSLDLGPLILGGNVFGWSADRDASFAVLDAFVAAGGTAIDTADAYSAWIPGNHGGESERIIGEWLAARGRRDDVVVATKVAKWSEHPGLSPANVRAAVDDSLRRLQTDYIDLYYAHEDDPGVPQEDVAAVFDELVRAGKVRATGVSNFTPDRLRTLVEASRENGLTPFSVSQDQWNLVERQVEATLVPTLDELGLVEAPYYALASGFLTGKYRPGATVDSVRAQGGEAILQREGALELLAALDDVAGAHRVPVAAVALAWLRAHPVVAAPIASARTVDQLPALVASFGLELTPEEVTRLSATSVAPA